MEKRRKSQKWLREEWVRRLRSGEFRQGKVALAQRCGFEWQYCCLGVACTILVEEGEMEWSMISGMFGAAGGRFNNEGGVLPDAAIKRFGTVNRCGTPRIGRGASLSCLNDAGTSFKAIANRLESGRYWK